MQCCSMRTSSEITMATVAKPQLMRFPLLKSTEYDPLTFIYADADTLRSHRYPDTPESGAWIEVFRKSIAMFHKKACADPSVLESERKAKADQFAEQYKHVLEQWDKTGAADVSGRGTLPLDCLSCVQVRDGLIRSLGFRDCFAGVKRSENEKALKLLPKVLKDLDEEDNVRKRLEQALRGVLAGNIFDLGALASSEMFDKAGADFEDTRGKLLDRPWVIDDMDRLLDRLAEAGMSNRHAYKKVVMFVDNAGVDVVLGMLPLARELVKMGTAVVMAANEVPSLNDVTADELREVLQRAGGMDPTISRAVQENALVAVSSGSDMPVIDLSKVSQELVDAARGADLVVLEGMGRSIETNLHADFICDSVNIGMIKHPEVATALHGRLYDCVLKFTEV